MQQKTESKLVTGTSCPSKLSCGAMQVRELMRESKLALKHLRQFSGIKDHFEGPVEEAVEQEELDHTCIICMDAPRIIAFLPCGHAVVCTGCSKLVMASGALCPMCRKHIATCSINEPWSY